MSNRLLFDGAPRSAPQHLRGTPAPASWATIRAAWRRYRMRQSIAELDNHLLKDIGISFAEAEAEANKPFWQK